MVCSDDSHVKWLEHIARTPTLFHRPPVVERKHVYMCHVIICYWLLKVTQSGNWEIDTNFIEACITVYTMHQTSANWGSDSRFVSSSNFIFLTWTLNTIIIWFFSSKLELSVELCYEDTQHMKSVLLCINALKILLTKSYCPLLDGVFTIHPQKSQIYLELFAKVWLTFKCLGFI